LGHPDERRRKWPLPNPFGLHSLPSSFSSALGNSRDQPQRCLSNDSEVVTGADRAAVTTSLPLCRVTKSHKARGCGNGMDNGLFLLHCTANLKASLECRTVTASATGAYFSILNSEIES